MSGGLASRLNALLEAERAGARVAALLVLDSPSAEGKALARTLQADENRWCRVLETALTGLDETPSGKVGDFHARAAAIPDLAERLDFLNRGQRWVVRKLDELLPLLPAGALRGELDQMRRSHLENIQAVEALLAAGR